jgi:hypothetical protein
MNRRFQGVIAQREASSWKLLAANRGLPASNGQLCVVHATLRCNLVDASSSAALQKAVTSMLEAVIAVLGAISGNASASCEVPARETSFLNQKNSFLNQKSDCLEFFCS